MKNSGKYIFFFMALSVISLTACEGPGDGKIVVSQTAIQTSTIVTSGYAPRNPYLADSVAPIGHINSAQSTGVSHAGPSGPSEALSIENGGLTYTHLGPAHFGYAISPEYANGRRVIWSNGGDRISKLDYESLQVIDEFFLEDSPVYEASEGAITTEQADADIRWLDLLPKWPYTGLGTLFTSVPMVKKYLGAGLAGVYYLASSDNILYVGGKNSILAYADADPQDPQSRIVLKNEWVKPPEITGGFNSMNMTYDGWLVSITDDGWVVLISRCN
jgi:hypothetical protein